MASKSTKPERKHQQLGELLKQQQEPFVLDIYLIERGYLRKSLSTRLQTSRFGCCNANLRKFISISTKGIPSCSKIVKALLKKFGHNNETRNNEKQAKVTFNVAETQRNRREVAERDRLSSASSTTVFNSHTESEKGESPSWRALEGLRLSNMTDDEAFAGGEFEFQFMANNKQHSPVSVLEQFPLSSKSSFLKRQEQESQTTCTVSLPNKLVTDDSKLSSSVCQLHFQSISEKPKRIGSSGVLDYDPMKLVGLDNSPSTTQFMKSKRMLHETKQLLFDCVREIVEIESNAIGYERVKKCHKQLCGTEELGNLLFQRIKACDKQDGNEASDLTSLLSLDVFGSIPAREWSDFEFEKREICTEIGNAITEEITRDIIVEAMTF